MSHTRCTCVEDYDAPCPVHGMNRPPVNPQGTGPDRYPRAEGFAVNDHDDDPGPDPARNWEAMRDRLAEIIRDRPKRMSNVVVQQLVQLREHMTQEITRMRR